MEKTKSRKEINHEKNKDEEEVPWRRQIFTAAKK